MGLLTQHVKKIRISGMFNSVDIFDEFIDLIRSDFPYFRIILRRIAYVNFTSDTRIQIVFRVGANVVAILHDRQIIIQRLIFVAFPIYFQIAVRDITKLSLRLSIKYGFRIAFVS